MTGGDRFHEAQYAALDETRGGRDRRGGSAFHEAQCAALDETGRAAGGRAAIGAGAAPDGRMSGAGQGRAAICAGDHGRVFGLTSSAAASRRARSTP